MQQEIHKTSSEGGLIDLVRLSPEEKARRKKERFEKKWSENQPTPYENEKRKREKRHYEDIGGRY